MFAKRFDPMRACSPNSSMIDRVAFDDESHIMSVSFRDTGKYIYYDVPKTIFEALCKASSAGAFFNAQVKGHFRCSRNPERRRFGPNA